MAKTTIPIALQILAESDPSVQQQLAATEKAISDSAKRSQRTQEWVQQEVGKSGKALGDGVAKQTKKGADQAGQTLKKLAADARRQFSEVQKQAGAGATAIASSLERVSGSIRQLLPQGRGGLLGGLAGAVGQSGTLLGKVFQQVDFAKFSGLTDELNKKLSAMGANFAAISASGVVFSAAMSGALLGAAGVAINTAAGFEQAQAKLETVLKSTAKARATMGDAVKLAAKTPFDVEGLVTAAVQLEVYGNRSKETLPLVADLAAGMGKRIEDTALVVGKAMSGSLEGF